MAESRERPSLIWRDVPAAPTYYEQLEIARTACFEVVKGAYRALVRKHHPDSLSPELRADGEERMKALNEAYLVLSNPEAREEYDRRIGVAQ
jgi:DnaJ-class molecular chaperone